MVMKGFLYVSESAFIELILADISLPSKLQPASPLPDYTRSLVRTVY